MNAQEINNRLTDIIVEYIDTSSSTEEVKYIANYLLSKCNNNDCTFCQDLKALINTKSD